MWDVLEPCQSPGSPSSAWKHWLGHSGRQDSTGKLRYRSANTSLLLEPSLIPRSPASSVLASTRRLHTQAGTHSALNQKVAQLNALSFCIPVCRMKTGMRFCGGALQPAGIDKDSYHRKLHWGGERPSPHPIRPRNPEGARGP